MGTLIFLNESGILMSLFTIKREFTLNNLLNIFKQLRLNSLIFLSSSETPEKRGYTFFSLLPSETLEYKG